MRAVGIGSDDIADHAVEHALDDIMHIVILQHIVALLVHDLTLLAQDIIILQQLLTHIEVVSFYALLRLLVSMLVTVLGLVNKLPVIGTVNRGLGWLVGAGTALLDVYLVLCILWGIIVITGGNLNVLNDTVMSSSLYYKIFNLFNPFL